MKKISMILFALMGLFLTTACGGGGDDDNRQEPTPSAPHSYTQSESVAAAGGEQTVTLTSLGSAVSKVEGNPSWLSVVPQFYSSGAPTIKLIVSENTETTERKSAIIITAASGDKVILTVTQAAGSIAGGNDIDDIHNELTDQPAYSR